MLTPWVKPVTAGKKIAKTAQKPRLPGGADQLPSRTATSQRVKPPTKKETRAAARVTITTYWKRVAQSAPSQANTNRNATAHAATNWGEGEAAGGTKLATASPKPMQ